MPKTLVQKIDSLERLKALKLELESEGSFYDVAELTISITYGIFDKFKDAKSVAEDFQTYLDFLTTRARTLKIGVERDKYDKQVSPKAAEIVSKLVNFCTVGKVTDLTISHFDLVWLSKLLVKPPPFRLKSFTLTLPKPDYETPLWHELQNLQTHLSKVITDKLVIKIDYSSTFSSYTSMDSSLVDGAFRAVIQLLEKNHIQDINITQLWPYPRPFKDNVPSGLEQQIEILLKRNRGYTPEGFRSACEVFETLKDEVNASKKVIEPVTEKSKIPSLVRELERLEGRLKEQGDELYERAKVLLTNGYLEAGYYLAEYRLCEPARAYKYLTQISKRSPLFKAANFLAAHVLIENPTLDPSSSALKEKSKQNSLDENDFEEKEAKETKEVQETALTLGNKEGRAERGLGSLEEDDSDEKELKESQDVTLSLPSKQENVRQGTIIKHLMLAGDYPGAVEVLAHMSMDYVWGPGASLGKEHSINVSNAIEIGVSFLHLCKRYNDEREKERKYEKEDSQIPSSSSSRSGTPVLSNGSSSSYSQSSTPSSSPSSITSPISLPVEQNSTSSMSSGSSTSMNSSEGAQVLIFSSPRPLSPRTLPSSGITHDMLGEQIQSEADADTTDSLEKQKEKQQLR